MKTYVPYLVLAFAILQPITSYISTSSSDSRFMDSVSTPLITPAGYAFSIWSVIVLGSLLYAIYQVLPRRRNHSLYAGIAPYAAITFAGFSAWLYAAEQEWLFGTLAIFLVMGFCLYRILTRVMHAHLDRHLSRTEQVITYGTFGLYAGWATVAIFANFAATVKFSGISDLGASGLAWQLCVLVAATLTALSALRRFRGSTPYAAAILWAFIAIIFGTYEKLPNAGYLPYVAAIATLLIAIQYARIRMKRN